MNEMQAVYGQAKKILKHQSKSALISLYLEAAYKVQVLEQELKKRMIESGEVKEELE